MPAIVAMFIKGRPSDIMEYMPEDGESSFARPLLSFG